MKKLMTNVHHFIGLRKCFSNFFQYFFKMIENLWIFGVFRKNTYLSTIYQTLFEPYAPI